MEQERWTAHGFNEAGDWEWSMEWRGTRDRVRTRADTMLAYDRETARVIVMHMTDPTIPDDPTWVFYDTKLPWLAIP